MPFLGGFRDELLTLLMCVGWEIIRGQWSNNDYTLLQDGRHGVEITQIYKMLFWAKHNSSFILNKNINATCNNFKDFTELQFI